MNEWIGKSSFQININFQDPLRRLESQFIGLFTDFFAFKHFPSFENCNKLRKIPLCLVGICQIWRILLENCECCEKAKRPMSNDTDTHPLRFCCHLFVRNCGIEPVRFSTEIAFECIMLNVFWYFYHVKLILWVKWLPYLFQLTRNHPFQFKVDSYEKETFVFGERS